jgi:hypothetical protein
VVNPHGGALRVGEVPDTASAGYLYLPVIEDPAFYNARGKLTAEAVVPR